MKTYNNEKLFEEKINELNYVDITGGDDDILDNKEDLSQEEVVENEDDEESSSGSNNSSNEEDEDEEGVEDEDEEGVEDEDEEGVEDEDEEGVEDLPFGNTDENEDEMTVGENNSDIVNSETPNDATTVTKLTINEETRGGRTVNVVKIHNVNCLGQREYYSFDLDSIDEADKNRVFSLISLLDDDVASQLDLGNKPSKVTKTSENVDQSKIVKELTEIVCQFGSGPGGDGDPRRNNGRGNDNEVDPSITFEKIGGLEAHISYLKDNVIFPLAEPQAQKDFSGRPPPKGIMFYGIPGSGKTLLAMALVNELSIKLKRKVSFYYRKGPDTLSMWFGETNKILKRLFEEAARTKPSIIFFDEIDGLCPSRDRSSKPGGSEAYTTVVTTLLGLMDGVVRGEVFVVAATNRLESVDQAMLRPGRFDKKLVFHPPHEAARKKIIEINLKNWDPAERPSANVIDRVTKATTGFTGADLEKLCRDAFLIAFHRHVPNVDVNSNVTGLKVTPEDWMAAVNGMTKTSSMSFGSFLYVPSNVSTESLPLIANPTAAILKDLRTLAPLRFTEGDSQDETPLALSSYYVYDPSDENGYMVDNILLSNLLSDKQLAKFSTYIISEDTIRGNADFLEAVTQAMNASKSILVILRIDHLVNNFPGHMHILVQRLEKLRGKPCLILASAGCNLKSLNYPQLQSLFTGQNRTYGIESPKLQERKQFFLSIFQKKALALENADDTQDTKTRYGAKLMELEQRCLARTSDESLSSLMLLYGKLSISCANHRNVAEKGDLMKELDEIILQYTSNSNTYS